MNIDTANTTAVDRMMAARPVLIGVSTARDVVPQMGDRTLLHAGPPIGWERMSGPLKGAVIGAILFEGWAADEASATDLAAGGEISFDPCHHHQAVGPMAGVISPSMAVYVVENTTHGNFAYSNMNEGYGKVLRYGAFSPDVLERLQWINDEMAELLRQALAETGGIDLRALLAEALHMGDEGHNRNKAGSILMLRALAPVIARVSPTETAGERVLQVIGDSWAKVL